MNRYLIPWLETEKGRWRENCQRISSGLGWGIQTQGIVSSRCVLHPANCNNVKVMNNGKGMNDVKVMNISQIIYLTRNRSNNAWQFTPCFQPTFCKFIVNYCQLDTTSKPSKNKIIWIFKRESIKKTILQCWFLYTLYKRIVYVLIPKPHFQAVTIYQLSLLPFWLVAFRRLAQSVAAMTAVVAAHVVAVPAGRFLTGCSLVHSTDTAAGLM